VPTPVAAHSGRQTLAGSRIGDYGQLDATPMLGSPVPNLYPMLNLLDDCSRLITGSRLYSASCSFIILTCSLRFREHGLPLCLYVDYTALLHPSPRGLTPLGWALKFYDISLDTHPTPQAKGKLSAAHLFGKAVPSVFAPMAIPTFRPPTP